MNTPIFVRPHWIVCLLLLFGSALHLPARPAQPVMHAAAEALHAARSAPDPLPKLREAMDRLRSALKNKAGYRVEAAKLVRAAIVQAEAKNRREADKLIDQAITKIEKGIAAGN